MASNRKYFLIVFTVISLTQGCKSKAEIADLQGYALKGKWKLDSVSLINGQYIPSDSLYETKTLTFTDSNSFTFEWWNDDVGNIYTGKYFINDNPKRLLKTLSLIPDIKISGNDTIRIPYLNFDIVSLDSNTLRLVGEVTYINRTNEASEPYTKNYIYKRKE